ncbi:N-acetylglucosamine kinase-like BadF-type ATPase [Krasilnikovia cinnamomea]|uniref:N-acetylglucosamine kinase-like BadF-type ATPase n=1 Tax=Krasilnikovia cinnamomea TaxID=349313 RepID=A0A4V2G7S8_9ACTN|nr:BadF/BadG/BcrA/BcrD ATPase family protein [Krasilnikovia cinnamomea]RZU53736.1 N-acetylglucosamine kinase-like BadF-type ATPase [Krasilnikovia cinnamomea]
MPDPTRASAARRPGSLVIGVEAGSAMVEVLVATVDGMPMGAGRSGSANPTALPVAQVAGQLATAVAQALADVDPDEVGRVVVGAAGVLWFSRGTSATALAQVWAAAGLSCPVRVVPDAVTAFAAGTCARSGSVLIAGAGAIAAHVDREAVTARIDGNGWLVGDDGSGFWIGRQAVRAVFADLDRRGEPTLLRDAVLAALTGDEDVPADPAEQAETLRAAVYDGPPIALAALAPLVPAAAEAGDRVAQRIVDRAVTLLVDTAAALVGEDPAGPLVLAGSLLGRGGPIGREVARRLAGHDGGPPLRAGSGAGGAAWLAARSLAPHLGPDAHARLTGGA